MAAGNYSYSLSQNDITDKARKACFFNKFVTGILKCLNKLDHCMDDMFEKHALSTLHLKVLTWQGKHTNMEI